MTRARKTYPPEFKAEAVWLAREDGIGWRAQRRALAWTGRWCGSGLKRPTGRHRLGRRWRREWHQWPTNWLGCAERTQCFGREP